MTSVSLTRTVQPALSDRQVYRLLFAATLPVFLVAVVTRRFGLLLGGDRPGSTRSILAEAKDIGSSTLHFAFMG